MPLNIAIDGPVGAGKTSVAEKVARALGVLHLDTGAMYRAFALRALDMGVPTDDEGALSALAERVRIEARFVDGAQATFADGRDVTALLRTPRVSAAASDVSRFRAVRERMVALQREIAARADMVLEGRDIGTRVLPDATVKIFLTATPEARARRRFLELARRGAAADEAGVLRDVIARDRQDETRAVDPLRRADDALLVDTTHLTEDEAVAAILNLVREAAPDAPPEIARCGKPTSKGGARA